MPSTEIMTAILLGLTGGITPGPIILLAFSEIRRSPKVRSKKWGDVFVFCRTYGIFIGLFLVATSSFLQIPIFVFHSLAILGIGMLLFVAFRVLQIRRISTDKETKKIGIGQVIILMLLNGPLYLFWISVCVPAAFRLGEKMHYGEYIFVIIFEISMMVGLAVMLFGFNSFRRLLTNEKVVGKVFLALSILIFLLALKIFVGEILYFHGLFW